MYTKCAAHHASPHLIRAKERKQPEWLNLTICSQKHESPSEHHEGISDNKDRKDNVDKHIEWRGKNINNSKKSNSAKLHLGR
jgi:hypothetical protein